jgi:hypothetical protein
MTTLPPSLTNQEAPAGRPPGLPVENRELETRLELAALAVAGAPPMPHGANDTEKRASGTDHPCTYVSRALAQPSAPSTASVATDRLRVQCPQARNNCRASCAATRAEDCRRVQPDSGAERSCNVRGSFRGAAGYRVYRANCATCMTQHVPWLFVASRSSIPIA